MVAIVVHIIFGITLLFAMGANVEVPEQAQEQIQVEGKHDKNL